MENGKLKMESDKLKETDYDKCTAKKSSPFDLNQKRRLFSKQKEAEQRKGEIDEKESDCIAACSGHGNVSDSLWGYIQNRKYCRRDGKTGGNNEGIRKYRKSRRINAGIWIR